MLLESNGELRDGDKERWWAYKAGVKHNYMSSCRDYRPGFTNISLSDWYPSLAKPSFTPPGSVIGLIWIIIFTLMGIALFLVWREGLEKPDVRIALSIFAAQLLVNILWSAAFFGLKVPFIWISSDSNLVGIVLITIVKFWTISRAAALLLVPYICWVSFAAYLNYTLWRLNP